MRRKLAGALIAFVMLFSLIPTAVFADAPTIRVGEEDLDLSKDDSDATVEISLENNPGIISTKFKIVYDADALSVKDVAAQEKYTAFPGLKHDDIKFDSNATGEQTITFNFNTGAATDYTGNGPIASVTFVKTAKTEAKDYEIGIVYEADDGNTTNAAGDDVESFVAVAGVVHVKDSSGSGTSDSETPVNVPVIQVGEADLDLDKDDAEATVEISLENNPGIISTKFQIAYDADALSVKDVAAQEKYTAFPGLKHDDIKFDSNATGEQTITFNFNTGAATDYTGNGPIASVTFVKTAKTEAKDYEIGIVYKADDGNTTNAAGNDVESFKTVAGTVHAKKSEPSEKTYAVTVKDGTAEKAEYAEGETVKITADTITGKNFVKWESSDGVTFADETKAETSFTMPGKAVTVTATYEDTPYLPLTCLQVTTRCLLQIL